MTIENATYISELDTLSPDGLTDLVSEGEDQIKLIKKTLTKSFPYIDAPVTFSAADFNNYYDNISFGGSTFSLGGNTTHDVTVGDLTSIPPRSYNDARYIQPSSTLSGSLLFSNGNGLKNQEVNNVSRNTLRSDVNSCILGDANADISLLGDVNLVGEVKLANNVSILEAMYPVGSIYENGAVGTNPGSASMLGFGTWAVHGADRVAVAQMSSDFVEDGVSFAVLDSVGGTTNVALNMNHMPTHTHTYRKTGGTGAYTDNLLSGDGVLSTSATTDETGVTYSTHSNIMPYIVIHRWVRTA